MQILNLWVKKIDGCRNISEKSSTTKLVEHIPCGYSMSIIWRFGGIKNKYEVYRVEDCIEKFCESKTINFEKKKTKPLIIKEYKSYLNQTNCHIH